MQNEAYHMKDSPQQNTIIDLEEENTANTPPPLDSLDRLCIDALNIVFNFIPAYQFFGTQTITTVSQKWKKLFESLNFKDKESFSKIIDACKKHPEGVLYILSDDAITQHLSFKKFKTLVSLNEDLAWYLINTPELGQILTIDYLVTLGINHLSIAMHILKTPELLKKLKAKDLATLGNHHPQVASHIFNTPELCNTLSSIDLVIFSEENPAVAAHIFQTEELRNILGQDDLVSVANNNPTVAWPIIKENNLLSTLDSSNLASLANKNLKIARHIFNKTNLCHDFEGYDFALFAQNHPEIVKSIIHSPEYLARLDIEDLILLGEKDPDTADWLLNSPEVQSACLKLDATESYESFEEESNEDQEEMTNLDELTIGLAHHHLHIARKVLANSELLAKLDSNSIYGLVAKAATDYALAQQILDCNALADKLNNEMYVELAHADIKIAKLIRSNEHGRLIDFCRLDVSFAHEIMSEKSLPVLIHFTNRTSSAHGCLLAQLGSMSLDLAEQILNTPALVANLLEYQAMSLGMFGESYPSIARKMLEEERFSSKLNNTGKHSLINFCQFSGHICEKAKALLGDNKLTSKFSGCKISC